MKIGFSPCKLNNNPSIAAAVFRAERSQASAVSNKSGGESNTFEIAPGSPQTNGKRQDRKSVVTHIQRKTT